MLTLLLVVLLIVGIFLLLEKVRKAYPPQTPARITVGERQHLPPRPVHPAYEQQQYTSAAIGQSPVKARRKAAGPGTMAIIIDDMGSSVQEAKALLAIDLPITFSIIPGLAKVKSVAEIAHERGRQVMLHMPMEPQGYPEQRLEQNGLLLNQSDDEIYRRLQDYFGSVPYVVGANNHMGSRFTEDEGKMRAVLGALKERGLFFIDSRTSPKSVGYALAGRMGLEAGTRNVFLDNVQEVGAIRAQLEETARVARRRGSAIAIGHPHSATIQALRETMPELKRSGITFVYASELVR
jgi:polysaccharide deacetylase 2 family uncharacterized protein YibQ